MGKQPKKPAIYTPAKFAEKIGISRATVWRWTTDPELEKRLKMYDARKIDVGGKTFIEVVEPQLVTA